MPPTLPAFVVADFNLAPAPVPLGPLGLAADCFGYLQNPTSIGFAPADAKGRARVNRSLTRAQPFRDPLTVKMMN